MYYEKKIQSDIKLRLTYLKPNELNFTTNNDQLSSSTARIFVHILIFKILTKQSLRIDEFLCMCTYTLEIILFISSVLNYDFLIIFQNYRTWKSGIT